MRKPITPKRETKWFSFMLCILSLLPFSSAIAFDKQRFEFSFQNLRYVGEVLHPSSTAKGIVVFVPGHGPTELVDGNQFIAEREFLAKQGFSVVYWDKAGCGLSEGNYDHNQSIASSAQEAVAALTAIQKMGLSNTDNVGMWSISRGGWIVPKIFEIYDGIRFWISVSGTTELDNSRYMLEANLKAEGRDSAKIELLMSEWDEYQRILVRGGSIDEFNANTTHLMVDPYFNSNDFQMTAEVLKNIQTFFQSGAMVFDEKTNLAIMYPNLKDTLKKLDFPVLTLLGRLDSQIDWAATGALYLNAEKEGNMQLTQVYLDNCNHIMQQSKTGGVNEALPPDTPPCEGYYDAMASWLAKLP